MPGGALIGMPEGQMMDGRQSEDVLSPSPSLEGSVSQAMTAICHFEGSFPCAYSKLIAAVTCGLSGKFPCASTNCTVVYTRETPSTHGRLKICFGVHPAIILKNIVHILLIILKCLSE